MSEDLPEGHGGRGTDTPGTATNNPWLVVLCGLPGVGKSTVADYVTDRLDATRVRTDAVRKELFDDPQYTDAETDTVYRELYERSRALLDDNESVVLDATFAERRRRREARTVAEEMGTEFRLLEVVCGRETVERRIERREDISDADVDIYRQFREEFDPIEMDHATIDNSGSREATHEQIDRVLFTDVER